MIDEFLKCILTGYTVEHLSALARELELKGYSRLNKEELVDFLLEKADQVVLREQLHAGQSVTVETVPPPPVRIETGKEMEKEKKEKKDKLLSKMATWASILGIPLAVVGLMLAFILSSSSDKQLNDVKNKLDRYDPLARDGVIQEKDRLLTEKEKKIKELEKAIKDLCVGAPHERQEALAELQKGNMEKARELLRKAIAAQCGVVAADYFQLGDAYFFDKKPDYRAALAAYLEADRLAPENSEYINMVGKSYSELGEYDRAVEYFEKALDIDKKVYGKEHPNVAKRLNSLGAAYWSLGDYRNALTYCQQALVIDEKVYGKEHPNLARDLNKLGAAYYRMGRKDQAKFYFEKAYAIRLKMLGKNHPDSKATKEWLEAVNKF